MAIDFSTDTRRQWKNIFKLLRENKVQPRILHPARCYKDKNMFAQTKLGEFPITYPC